METKEKLKQNKAITLIALIITIIIMLILAVVAIALINRTELFTQTKKSKIEAMKGESKQQINLDITELQTSEGKEGRKLTLKTIYEQLPIIDTKVTFAKYNDGDKKLIGVYEHDKSNSYSFEINENFEITGEIGKANAFLISISDDSITTKSVKVVIDTSTLNNLKNEFTYVAIQTNNVNNQKRYENISTTNFEITGLFAGTDYNFYVLAYDNDGNCYKSETISKRTKDMPNTEKQTGIITLNGLTWTNNKASVVVTTSNTDMNLKLQYQINDENWTDINSGDTINGLVNGDIVYAKLTDGVNNTYAVSIKVVDDIPPEITLTQDSVTKDSIIVTAKATDNESGIPEEPTYVFYLNGTQVQSSKNATYNATELQSGINYTIKVEVKDLTGNLASKEITIKTKIGVNYGTSISNNYINLYSGYITGKASLVTKTIENDSVYDGNYAFPRSLVSTCKSSTLLNIINNSSTNDTYIYSGTRTYNLQINSTTNRWVFLYARGGGLTTGIVLGNLKLGFYDGSLKNLNEAARDGYIEPLVICSGSSWSTSYIFKNVKNVLAGGYTSSGNFADLHVVFKVKNIPFSKVQLYSNVNYSTQYDGLQIHQLEDGFEISTEPW